MYKPKVAFIIDFDKSSWYGGFNYYLSLFRAIDESDAGFDTVVFCKSISDFDGISFTHIKLVQMSIFDKKSILGTIDRVFLKFLNVRPILNLILSKFNVNVVSHAYVGRLPKTIKQLSWIPDLQHVFLPALFSNKRINYRDELFTRISEFSDRVIVSSESARSDLINHFNCDNNKVVVYKFLPNFNWEQLSSLISECEDWINHEPLIVFPGQFWIHKNHYLFIKALGLLKDKINFRVVFIGAFADERDSDYSAKILAAINDLGLNEHVTIFSGIPYVDVIRWIIKADVVVNASLFEGWSTVVEEAKYLRKTIACSDIPVHREQLSDIEECFFFPVDNSVAIATVLEQAIIGTTGRGSLDIDRYTSAKNKNVVGFIRCLEEISREHT